MVRRPANHGDITPLNGVMSCGQKTQIIPSNRMT